VRGRTTAVLRISQRNSLFGITVKVSGKASKVDSRTGM